MDVFRVIALTLVIVGAVDWGLLALFDFDLVMAIFGGDWVFRPTLASRIVYGLVALCGLYALSFYRSGEERKTRT